MKRTFGYTRAIAPMMWVLVGLSSVELIVVHALLAFWYPRVAIFTSLMTSGGIVWLIATIGSFGRYPVIVDPNGVQMRIGRLRPVRIPAADIAGLRATWNAETIKKRDVLNMAIIAYPNIVVDLVRPLPGRRGIVAVAHRLDDPAGFAAAIDALGRRDD